jgi:hypothetical protein
MKWIVLMLPLFAAFSIAGKNRDARATDPQTPIRVGIIGLDTSHAVEFTRILNDSASADHVPGARVIAAYKGGSPDIEASANRIEGFTTQLKEKWGLEIVPDIPTLCSKVDAILLLSVDGRKHLEQVKPVFAARKRVFIDKPLAASLSEARAIARLGAESGVPWFSCSSLRYQPAIQSLKQDPALGAILGCDAYSPSPTEPHHPDLFWYGIHGVEILFALMGPGCESVVRIHTPGTDVVAGTWKGGRIGTFRGIREGKEDYGAVAFGQEGIKTSEPITGPPYAGMLREVVKFFQTGVPPLSVDEMLEIMAFMQAADLSRERGGKTVPLSELAGP